MDNIKRSSAFAIMPPWGFDTDFTAEDSIAGTANAAWMRFCRPALKREGYEEDGFSAVAVVRSGKRNKWKMFTL